MNEPLVSVIVPVYKVGKYLDKCLESIIGQTYKNLEIILVDDGSPDNSPEICDDWAQKIAGSELYIKRTAACLLRETPESTWHKAIILALSMRTIGSNRICTRF